MFSLLQSIMTEFEWNWKDLTFRCSIWCGDCTEAGPPGRQGDAAARVGQTPPDARPGFLPTVLPQQLQDHRIALHC